MIPSELSSEDLVDRLLTLSETEPVSILDACGKRGWGPGLLVAGIRERECTKYSDSNSAEFLSQLEEIDRTSNVLFFTVSYDLGRILQGTCEPKDVIHRQATEPLFFAASYEAVVVHDYSSGATFIEGAPEAAGSLENAIKGAAPYDQRQIRETTVAALPEFEMSKAEYISKIEEILELIRSGDTYQTNLTQKITVDNLRSDARGIYMALKRDHPAAFSAFIERPSDHVLSISPERFFRTWFENGKHRIEASPIKGTRPRGGTPAEDVRLREELASSAKDRAENIMITDLLRNDLGRVCEFGSVKVDSLCRIEELPSLFHLVSTISGDLSEGARISDILKALFPCGSITGCPKIRTMEIIDDLEPSERGLSMGSIGFSYDRNAMPELDRIWNPDSVRRPAKGQRCYDLSVAIRTMVIREGVAEFNVGGGVVIDSDPDCEYQESLDKAAAILKALGAEEAANKRPTSRPAEQST